MENENTNIKNTAPATMTDKGPRGTTRKKSKDGRYTAEGGTDDYSYEVEERYKDPKKQVAKHTKRNKDETFLNKNFYEPLFQGVMQGTMLKYFVHMAGDDPNKEAFLIKSNRYNDEKLGIDFQMGVRLRTPDGGVAFDEKTLTYIDLKVVYTRDYEFDEPNLTFNLYQKHVPDEKHEDPQWEDSQFLKKHINNNTCFIIPKMHESKRSLVARMRTDPNYQPQLEEAKMFWMKTSELKEYIQSRFLNNDMIQKVMDAYKQDKLDSFFLNEKENPLYNYTRRSPYHDLSYEIELPVPGEDFKAKLLLVTADDGKKDIRLFVPARMSKSIKRCIEKNVKFPQR